MEMCASSNERYSFNQTSSSFSERWKRSIRPLPSGWL